MRKVLFTLLLILVLILSGITITKGLNIVKYDIWGIKDIIAKDEEIDDLNLKLSDLVSTTYPSTLKKLESSAQTMEKTKSEYESKALLISEKDSNMQTEKYEIEFLWTKIGNYAQDNDVEIKIDVTDSQISGRYDLNFTVSGKYSDITQFIYDIENDSKLGFKIEKFKMVPSENGVQATFSCTEIKIDIENSNQSVTDKIEKEDDESKKSSSTNTSSNTSLNTTNSTNTSTNSTNSTHNLNSLNKIN